MTKVAITGGIGSGKSYVCRRLAARGIEVYDCDAGAKRLMRTSEALQDALKKLVGENVYQGNVLQKRVLAEYLLQSEAHKQAINDIVHPAVARDFEESGLDWLESAIYYESGFHARVHINKVVVVSSPRETRIHRIMERDAISREKAEAWINAQLSQEEVIEKADFELINDGQHDIDRQIEQLLTALKGDAKHTSHS